MAVFVTGLIGVGVLYLLILAVGVWASTLAKNNSEEEMMLAGRSIGFWIGSLTMMATWVGGGYINGTAEAMYSRGLLGTQVPVGYSLSLLIGAIFFVKPMRDMGCVTLLDPFQKKYGFRLGGLLILPCMFSDLFWVGSILSALGSSLMVLTDLQPVASVVISACFVAAYTSVGAMYSVTYTDVVQIFFVLGGLVLSAPFILHHEQADQQMLTTLDWVGSVPPQETWQWVDVMLLLVLGGMPCQAYMQRILSIQDTRMAQVLSTLSVVGCMLMAVPPAFLGIVARTVDWNAVPEFHRNITEQDATIILPLVLRYLTPPWVAFFGLGAISAAVMSSADSSILGFSSLLSRNVYKHLFRPKASEREVLWVMRLTILAISVLSASIALTVRSIYYLAVLSSDLIYAILFPQLLLVVYFKHFVNSYGFLASILLGTLVRLLCKSCFSVFLFTSFYASMVPGGEEGLGLPCLLRFPGGDGSLRTQDLPYRTFAMLVSLFSHLLFSWLANMAFKKGAVSYKYDFLNSFSSVTKTGIYNEKGSRRDFSETTSTLL